jgi:hypothetical protein
MHTWVIILLIALILGGAGLAIELLYIGLIIFLVMALIGALTAPVSGTTILIIVVVILLLRGRRRY